MAQPEHEACLLLGSNIRPEHNLPLALDLLRKQLGIRRVSSVWETTAVGSDGPNFLNVALLVTTPLDSHALKEQILHPIETRLGRVRTQDKNAPRTMDIDLILFDGQLLDASLWKYAFRAVPVAEIMPDTLSEQGKKLKDVSVQLARTAHIRLRTGIPVAEIVKQSM